MALEKGRNVILTNQLWMEVMLKAHAKVKLTQMHQMAQHPYSQRYDIHCLFKSSYIINSFINY